MFSTLDSFANVAKHFCKLLILFSLITIQAWAQGTYTTNYTKSENPISEGGRWLNGGATGLKWSNVQTLPGMAYGTQTGSAKYNDSTAVLGGSWGQDQSAQAVVKITQLDRSRGGLFEEVELRLRTTVAANSITGYEINCSIIPNNPYLQIVRWNGPLGSWTELDGRSVGCKNGDVLKATAVGNTITAYKNGTAVFSVTDNTFKTGAPGIGFYLQGGFSSFNSHFGFSSFTATDGTTSDTTPPTAPANLSGSAVSATQINLTWNASTDNTGVSGYTVYRNGTKIGTASGTSYSDTGLSQNTSYTYTVSAMDSAGNVSPQSAPIAITTPASDTTPPSVPGGLKATSVTPNSVTIAWNPSTDNVAVSGYQVFRNGSKIATVGSTSYSDSGLSSSTGYSYTVAAFDGSNNVSAQSSPLSVTTSTGSSPVAPLFVQTNQSGIGSGSSLASSFNKATSKGNTLIAYVVWSNTAVVTVSDSQGNAFKAASSPIVWAGKYSAQVFYASNIAGGADSITARFGSSSSGVLYIHEYAGIDPTNPIDVVTSATGSGSTLNSGTAATTAANDLLFGAGASDDVVTSAGSGFAARNMGQGHVTEDRAATITGSYNASATHTGNYWAMQLIAFRSVSSGGTGTQTTWSISGTISGGAGSLVSLSGAQSASATADSNGNYTFSSLANGSYVVTPSKSGYTFSPASSNVTVNGANVNGTNFTAANSQTWSISGTISGGAGSTVALSGAKSASTTADTNGNFAFTGLSNGSYTVTPSKSGYTFSPASTNVTVNGANVSNTNFAATASGGSHSVDLNWIASTSSSVSGYKVYRSVTSGGPYTLLNAAPVTSIVYTDSTVSGGATYYYVVTAVDSSGNESIYSNEARAVVPTP